MSMGVLKPAARRVARQSIQRATRRRQYSRHRRCRLGRPRYEYVALVTRSSAG